MDRGMSIFDTRAYRAAAAILALAYVAIQSFQWFAFARLGAAATPGEALLQGADALNLARAGAMLASFFGLIVLFAVCCAIGARRRPDLAILAFLGFLGFCFLEIALRSIELFHIFVRLPARYLTEGDAATRAALIDQATLFAQIQHALYFPLGLFWILGSVLLAFALGPGRIDRLAKFALGFNALRLVARTIDSYMLGQHYDALYGALYLPLVYLTFVPLAAWLWWTAPRAGEPAPAV